MSHVTIPDYTPRETFTVSPGGSSGPFSLPSGFVVFTPSSDIKFYDDGVQLSYADPPGSSTQFAFSGTLIDGGYQGGTLTLGGVATSGSVMSAVRDIPIERTTDFSYPSSTLDLEGLNTQLDKLFAIFQDREANNERNLRQPVTDSTNIDYIPSSTGRAGLLLGFDADGQPTAAVESSKVSAAMAAVIAATPLSAARTAMGVPGLADANTFTARQVWAKGADIASATTLALGTDGNYFDVTGTTAITGITAPAGLLFMLQFDGALTLTHHATNLSLPGGANITTAAGDRAICFAEAANQVRVLHYQRATGVPGSGGAAKAAFRAHKNGSAQTGVADSTNTVVTFGTEVFDIGGYYNVANSRWTPPAGTVMLSASVFLTGTITAGATFVVQFFKNSGVVAGVVQFAATNNAGAHVTAIDTCDGDDFYEVLVFIDLASGTGVINGAAQNTWFAGSML